MPIATLWQQPVERADARPDPDELVACHYTTVYNLAYRTLGRRADAEDITQQTFVRALARVGELREPAAAGAWLCRIAANLCMDELRQRRKAGPAPEQPDPDGHSWAAVPDPDPLGTPADAVELAELRVNVWRATLALAPQQRLALALRELHGMRYAEIAETLGVSVSAVETLLFRARQSFRRAYEAGRGPAATSADCEWVLSRLSASIDAELGSIEQARVDVHLPACPTCQFAARELRATSRLYALVPLVAPPVGAQAAAMLTASGVGVGAASGLAGASGIAVSGASAGLVSSAVAGGAGTLAGAAAGMGSAAVAGIVATVGAAKIGLAAAVAVTALAGVAWAAAAPAEVASLADQRTAVDAVALAAATPTLPVVAVPPTVTIPSEESPIRSAVPNTAGATLEPAPQIAPVSELKQPSLGQPTSGGSEVRSPRIQRSEPLHVLVTPVPAAAPDKRSMPGGDASPRPTAQTAYPVPQSGQAAVPQSPHAARLTPEMTSAGGTQVHEQAGERTAAPSVPRQDPRAQPSPTHGREPQRTPEPPSVRPAPPTTASPLPARPPAADVQPRAGASNAGGSAGLPRPAQDPPAASAANAPTTNRRSSATSQPIPTAASRGAGISSASPPARAGGPPPQPAAVSATAPPAGTRPTQPTPTSRSPQPAPQSPQAQPAPAAPQAQPIPTSPPVQPVRTAPPVQLVSSPPARSTRAPASVATPPAQ